MPLSANTHHQHSTQLFLKSCPNLFLLLYVPLYCLDFLMYIHAFYNKMIDNKSSYLEGKYEHNCIILFRILFNRLNHIKLLIGNPLHSINMAISFAQLNNCNRLAKES